MRTFFSVEYVCKHTHIYKRSNSGIYIRIHAPWHVFSGNLCAVVHHFCAHVESFA